MLVPSITVSQRLVFTSSRSITRTLHALSEKFLKRVSSIFGCQRQIIASSRSITRWRLSCPVKEISFIVTRVPSITDSQQQMVASCRSITGTLHRLSENFVTRVPSIIGCQGGLYSINHSLAYSCPVKETLFLVTRVPSIIVIQQQLVASSRVSTRLCPSCPANQTVFMEPYVPSTTVSQN